MSEGSQVNEMERQDGQEARDFGIAQQNERISTGTGQVKVGMLT